MSTQIQRLSPFLVELKVEIPWDRVKSGMDASFDQVGRHARVKGFRPGKVPPNLVRKLYAAQVRGEVASRLIEESFFAAVQEHALPVVADPEVSTDEFKEGEALRFTARVEVRPEIERVTTDGIEVGAHSHPVTDEQVNEEIDGLRRRHAVVRAPEPMRPAQANDELTISYTVSIDGKERSDMSAQGRTVELGEGGLIEEFEKGLTGALPGETREITVNFPADHSSDELQGKTAQFKIEVTGLRERVLPDLDDEFAKDVGEFATLLELRLKIRERLERMAKDHTESHLKEQLIDKLIEKNPVDVPPSLVAQEERRALYEFASMMGMTGKLEQLGEELRESVRQRSERKVKAALLLAALARQEKIVIGDADVDARLAALAEQSGKHVAKLKAEFSGERRALLENQVLEEKLMGLLRSKATVKEVSPEEAHQHDHK